MRGAYAGSGGGGGVRGKQISCASGDVGVAGEDGFDRVRDDGMEPLDMRICIFLLTATPGATDACVYWLYIEDRLQLLGIGSNSSGSMSGLARGVSMVDVGERFRKLVICCRGVGSGGEGGTGKWLGGINNVCSGSAAGVAEK
jgi:hypothetical protein